MAAMKTKHRKILEAIFAKPTQGRYRVQRHRGAGYNAWRQIFEREGSRVRIELKGEQWRCHRPHPGKEARKYQVEEARELFERLGIHP
jgi:hypothetical protein